MIDPFKKISETDKIFLLNSLEADTIYFEKNKSIFSSIKMNNVLGIVIEGYIQIIKTDYNGNKIIIEELYKNSIFGSKISFFIDNECDMITKEETEIIVIDENAIMNYIHNTTPAYRQFTINLLEIMMNTISQKNEKIRILTKKTIRDKLLEYFDILSKRSGSRIIHIPSTYTELADYLAVDRSAMTREIKNLKDEKIIEVTSRRITLLYK